MTIARESFHPFPRGEESTARTSEQCTALSAEQRFRALGELVGQHLTAEQDSPWYISEGRRGENNSFTVLTALYKVAGTDEKPERGELVSLRIEKIVECDSSDGMAFYTYESNLNIHQLAKMGDDESALALGVLEEFTDQALAIGRTAVTAPAFDTILLCRLTDLGKTVQNELG